MDKLTYSHGLVGILPENEHLADQVMVKVTRFAPKLLSIPRMKANRLVGVEKKMINLYEDFGAQSFVDEDLLISSQLRAGIDFISTPNKGGYLLNFGASQFWTRKAKQKEFSSIHAYLKREGDTVFNHTFIQEKHYEDFLAENNLAEWRMPFSPDSVSVLAVSWQLIDANGGKWETVPPQQQKPNYIPRLAYHLLNDPKFDSVNIVYGSGPSYDEATHTFTVTAGCKIRMFFINTPMGQKEWSDEIELDLDTNQIKFI